MIQSILARPSIDSAARPQAAHSESGPVDRFEPCCAPPEDETGIMWGGKGHFLVNSQAAETMPDEMPPFFREAADRLGVLGAHPDRLRFRALRHLNNANAVDHYMNSELLQGREAPRDRYGYALLLKELEPDNNQPQKAGTLPYKIAEMYETLVAEFTLYRKELARTGPDSPLTRQFQENAIYTAGMLGHFVADATQPLHATVHHDGWDESREPNPEGFRTKPGLHSQFETRLVDRQVEPEAVADRISEPRRWEGDPLQWGLGLVQESQGLVRDLYTYEKNGELSPSEPSPRGLDLAVGRIARGAEVLRDLWYTAWLRSGELASQEDPSQDYLLAAANRG